VNRSRDKLLSRAGLAAVSTVESLPRLCTRARASPQRWRGSDNLLEHRRPVDFLSQGYVFLLESLSAVLRSSISVQATYQRMICPWSSRTGLERARNQRDFHPPRAGRNSTSYADPVVGAIENNRARARSSGMNERTATQASAGHSSRLRPKVISPMG